MEYLTLKQAADRLGVTKKKVYRAVSNGHLDAIPGTYKGQSALKVGVQDLNKWAEEWLEQPVEVTAGHPQSAPEAPPEHDRGTSQPPQEYPSTAPGGSQGYSSPPPEAYVAMLDRVTRAERRAVELEFEMRKHRLLLAENAESVHEREAKLKETQSKFQELNGVVKETENERDLARSEATQAKAELELLRTKLNDITMENENLWAEKRRPWWKKMFSTKGETG